MCKKTEYLTKLTLRLSGYKMNHGRFLEIITVTIISIVILILLVNVNHYYCYDYDYYYCYYKNASFDR